MAKNESTMIAISKIHDLPGVNYERQNDKAYSGLVSSIITQGIQEPLIVRQREDGEYQLVSGYRRRRAGELAKLSELPAVVYDMSEKEALEYYKASRDKADIPIPGKKVENEKPKEKRKKTEKAQKPKEEELAAPAGTSISKVLESRLAKPDEKALEELPKPVEHETYFVMLHPDYLEKSEFNTFSVDIESENYRELRKSIELNGIKDPVLARPKADGGLEVISGQRRLAIAKELNYPVPTLIQNIDDDDARILVADGNLHRDKITTYDLARAMKMKMEAMKRKTGRRRKLEPGATKINSDELIAKEMGMNVAKLNRLIKLSEATETVCRRVDDGSIPLSIASNIAFLEPSLQDHVIRLMDEGCKLSNENTTQLKSIAKTENMSEGRIKEILEGKYPQKQYQEPAYEIAKPEAAPEAPAIHTKPELPYVYNPVAKPEDNSQPAAESSTTVSDADKTETLNAMAAETALGQENAAAANEQANDRENAYETKVILKGDRLRRYFPDVSMTPREIEESIYSALEERRQREEKKKLKSAILDVKVERER